MNIEKLPKWAQEHIQTLTRERDNAVRSLNEWTDSQTERPFRIVERAGGADRTRNRYIEGRRITAVWAGIEAEFVLHSAGHISVYFGQAAPCSADDVIGVFPCASNAIELHRVTPSADATMTTAEAK